MLILVVIVVVLSAMAELMFRIIFTAFGSLDHNHRFSEWNEYLSKSVIRWKRTLSEDIKGAQLLNKISKEHFIKLEEASIHRPRHEFRFSWIS